MWRNGPAVWLNNCKRRQTVRRQTVGGSYPIETPPSVRMGASCIFFPSRQRRHPSTFPGLFPTYPYGAPFPRRDPLSSSPLQAAENPTRRPPRKSSLPEGRASENSVEPALFQAHSVLFPILLGSGNSGPFPLQGKRTIQPHTRGPFRRILRNLNQRIRNHGRNIRIYPGIQHRSE